MKYKNGPGQCCCTKSGKHIKGFMISRRTRHASAELRPRRARPGNNAVAVSADQRQLRCPEGSQRVIQARRKPTEHPAAKPSDTPFGKQPAGAEYALFRDMLDSQPWGTIAIDSSARVIAASAQTARLLGVVPEAGQALHDLLPQLPALCLHDAINLLGQGLEVEREGMCLWVKLCAVAEGDTVAATLSLIDITLLRREIDQRMASLRFLSHDLRSPQNSILALAQLHDLDHDAFGACGGMGRIAELARYSLALSEDFIISSLVGTMQRPDFIRFDLHETVRQLIVQQEVAAAARGIDLRLQAPPGGVWVRGVRVFVARAVQNLVDNAVNASPQGAAVSIVLRSVDHMADIQVCDSAGGLPGLPPRGRLRDFALGTSRAKLGFGLGLKVTTQVVQMHGGDLYAESNGGGTTFTMRIPCSDTRPAPVEAMAHA